MAKVCRFFKHAILLLIFISNEAYSQGFFEAIEIKSTEPNSGILIGEVDDKYVMCGYYFDESIGRWTGYYCSFDQFGNRETLLVEQVDTIIQLSNNGNLLSQQNTFHALSDFQDSLYFFSYDAIGNKLSSNSIISKSQNDFNGRGIMVVDNETFLCGRNYIDDPTIRDVKVLKLGQDSIFSFIELDSLSKNIALSLGINSIEEVVISCLHTIDGTDTRSYLIFLDKDLKKIRSTKDFNNVAFMTLNYGFLIDSEDNIVISGAQKENVNGIPTSFPCIAKFDSIGNHLWTKRVGKNVNNVQGLGKWNNIIESKEGDGYILAGSSTYQNLDTIKAKGTIVKIDFQGEEVWYREYVYDSSSHRVAEEFTDIIIVDDGYVASGTSINYVDDDTRPWLKSLIIKVDEQGVLDTFTATYDIPESFESIVVYPNPTINFLNLKNLKNVAKINVYNIEGDLIHYKSKNVSIETYSLDVSTFHSGIYIIELITIGNKRQVHKIVINEED